MTESVRYIHRTVGVPTARPPRLPEQQTMTTEQMKEKRVKKLTSILPDSLDVINESSETSEYSSSSLPLPCESVIRSPKRKDSVSSKARAYDTSPKDYPWKDGDRSVSPRKHSPSQHKNHAFSYDAEHTNKQVTTKNRSRKDGSFTSPTYETSENDSSGTTERLTQSESEGEEIDNYYTSSQNDEDDDDDESIDVEPGPSSLFNYLKNPGAKPANTNMNAQISFEEENSVLTFDYDGEENDDGDFSCSRQSLISSRHGEEDEELTWRSDPAESMSDWTITVINNGRQTAEHYHVHKNIVAVGKRRSDFFVGLFREHRQSCKRSNSTELCLPDSAAVMIPPLLDYIYCGDKALTLSSKTAPGLRYLSQFFGIRVLFERIMKFIQKDLSLRTVVEYYKGCTDLGDQKVLGIAARHAARNIHLVDISHELIEVMDPEFFCKVIASPGTEGSEKKVHLSLLVAKYCQLHKDTLDESMFSRLTAKDHLPHIHHSAAMSLLGMEADLVVATSLKSIMSMTSLQERCIKGLSSNWRELSAMEPTRTAQICRKLPSFVVTELLIKSLAIAKNDDGQQTTTRVLVKRSSAQKDKSVADSALKQEYEDKLEKLKVDFDKKSSHLQELCYEKDKHIQSYYEELSRFQRVQNAPDGKLVSSGKTTVPTTMPRMGKHDQDGFVLVGKKKGDPKYPVFYYKRDDTN